MAQPDEPAGRRPARCHRGASSWERISARGSSAGVSGRGPTREPQYCKNLPWGRLEVKLSDFAEDSAALGAESRWWRRLGRSFVSVDSYGLVLLLVVATYVVSVSVTETWAASIVLTIQLATVWLILRTSQARRGIRLVACIVLCLAAVVAAASFFVQVQYEVGAVSVVCCLLYLIAPFSIVRHLMLRPKIDTETLLGAVAAYLLIGMFFAFACTGGG